MKPFVAVTGRVLPSARSGDLAVPLPYIRAITEAGGIPFISGMEEGGAGDIARRADALLLSGGGDADPALFEQTRHPATGDVQLPRDMSETALIHAFAAEGKPILGICRGMQMIAVALGGTLHQHLPDLPGTTIAHADYATRHAVTLHTGTWLRRAYGRTLLVVNSTHHQAVDRPPRGFSITALSPDGVIEAIERGNIIGVQWHPERILPDGHLCIFKAFLAQIGP